MTVMPDLPDDCWPVDTSACADFETYDVPDQEMASALAAMSMRMLTGYSVGGCPGTLRPCTVSCASGSGSWSWAGGTFHPVNLSGVWVNMTCGCGWDCGHDAATTVRLPGWVASVSEVKVDGIVIPATDYRVDSGNLLVRTDGQTWPATQAMSLEDTEVGTFSVTYSTGAAVDALGAFAAGRLACEFAKALRGGKCDLPKSVVNITRQGITMQLTPGMFPDGLTNIAVVDAYVMRYNPHHLKTPPAVWSPDTAGGHVTTWSAP